MRANAPPWEGGLAPGGAASGTDLWAWAGGSFSSAEPAGKWSEEEALLYGAPQTFPIRPEAPGAGEREQARGSPFLIRVLKCIKVVNRMEGKVFKSEKANRSGERR